MLRLILVRHGQTDWNAQSRYQGQADIPLNDVGRQQAVAVAQRLASERIDILFASDLCRAWETATAIATARGQTLLAEPRLREMDFGQWQGLTHDEIHKRQARELGQWHAEPLYFAPPGGETLAQLADRIQSALQDARDAHQGKTVLWVSHGGPLRVLLCLALGLELQANWRFRIQTASVSELHLFEEESVLTLLNDTHHLDKTGT
jgi:alpha-ribazole phosphatase